MGPKDESGVAESSKPVEVPGFPLTKEFLEHTFEREVETFTAKMGTNPGDNYLSIMHAVDVIFKGECETKHYLIKCYPNHPGRRDFLDQMNVFEKELFMYSEFFPTLKQLAVDSGADEKVVNLSLAPFHGGNVVIAPSRENFIVMTDLRHSNYTMVDRTKGMNLEHATLVLKQMAKLHALAWAHKEKSGLEMLSTKYPNFIDEMYSKPELTEQFKSLMDQITENAIKMTGETLGGDHPAHANFKKIVESGYMDIMKLFMSPQGKPEATFEDMLRIKPEENKDYNEEPWLTGTHGDCWVNNMLFRYSESDTTKPADLIFVDFQIYREACPTVDIAYFFYSSVRAPIRKAHKDELLQAYHDAFVLTCKELNVRPYPGFSMYSLKRRFNRAELFGLLVALPLLNIVLIPSGESIDMDKEEGKDAMELFSKVLEGGDKNVIFRNEMAASITDLYDIGVL